MLRGSGESLRNLSNPLPQSLGSGPDIPAVLRRQCMLETVMRMWLRVMEA